MSPEEVPYVDLSREHENLRDEIVHAVEEVFDHGQFILGREVERFEERFADLCDTTYAVGVSSGTDALALALRALGVGAGDEVITAPNSFVASASAIALAGAVPTFADVGSDYNLDPEAVEEVIGPSTAAILPVHLTGRPARMDALRKIAEKHDLLLLEDAAQAVLAEHRGRRVGSLGDVGCFSLHPLKTLNACGDGGMVVTDDSDLAERLRVLRNIGLADRDTCVEWSGNSRLDTLQAAILLVKLDYLREWTEVRRRHAKIYREHLSVIDAVTAPVEKAHEFHVYHTFVIQAERRDQLKSHLRANDIGAAVHYPNPIHLQPAAEELGYEEGDFPVAERQADRILSLPVHQHLSEEQVRQVGQAIKDFYS